MISISDIFVFALSGVIVVNSAIGVSNNNDLKQEKKQLQKSLDFFEKIKPCDTLSAFENGHYQGLNDCFKLKDTIKIFVEVSKNIHYQDSTLVCYTNNGILYYNIIGKNHKGKGSIVTHFIKVKK